MPGKKTIRWDESTRETILTARAKLVEMGMRHPSIRAVLYLLMELPGWGKRHYDTLCGKLGEWRDDGLVPFGLFSDDGAGSGYRPLTVREIAERVKTLQELVPAKLFDDGTLRVVFIEHISLVDTIADFLDYEVPVVSSQGQLRREHLHSFMSGCEKVVKELGGNGIQIVGLTDYDRAGIDIFEAHSRWLHRIFGIEMPRWAITQEQIRAARLDLSETHQLDGFIAAYGVQRFRRELRGVLGLDGSH